MCRLAWKNIYMIYSCNSSEVDMKEQAGETRDRLISDISIAMDIREYRPTTRKLLANETMDTYYHNMCLQTCLARDFKWLISAIAIGTYIASDWFMYGDISWLLLWSSIAACGYLASLFDSILLTLYSIHGCHRHPYHGSGYMYQSTGSYIRLAHVLEDMDTSKRRKKNNTGNQKT